MKNIKKIIVIIMMLAVVVGIMPTMERNVEAADCEHDWCPVVELSELDGEDFPCNRPMPHNVYVYGYSFYMGYNGRIFANQEDVWDYADEMSLYTMDENDQVISYGKYWDVPGAHMLFGGWASAQLPNEADSPTGIQSMFRVPKDALLTTQNIYKPLQGWVYLDTEELYCSKCGAVKEKG